MNPDNSKIYVIIYVNKATPSLPTPSKIPDGRRKEKGGIEDTSVKRDKTVAEWSDALLVRHLVSAWSVIAVSEAEGWEERQNSSSSHRGLINMRAGFMTGNKHAAS